MIAQLQVPAIIAPDERGSGRIKRYYITHPHAIGSRNPITVAHEVYMPDGTKAIADMMLPFYGLGIMQRLLAAQLPGAELGNVVTEQRVPAPF